MPRWLFWPVLIACPLGLGIAVYLSGPETALFPGLLALFAFLVMWTAADFQIWTRRNATALRQPRPILMEGNVSVDAGISVCNLQVSFSNPGDLPIFITSAKAKLPGLVSNLTLGKRLVVMYFADPKMEKHPVEAIRARDFGRVECSIEIPKEVRENFWKGAVPVPEEFKEQYRSKNPEDKKVDLHPEKITLEVSYISGCRDTHEDFKDLMIAWDQDKRFGTFPAKPSRRRFNWFRPVTTSSRLLERLFRQRL